MKNEDNSLRQSALNKNLLQYYLFVKKWSYALQWTQLGYLSTVNLVDTVYKKLAFSYLQETYNFSVKYRIVNPYRILTMESRF